jgi:hypothetical protein
VVITKQPHTTEFAGILSDKPTTGSFPTVYTATGGEVNPVPIPEPATFLAWAGLIGAGALARASAATAPPPDPRATRIVGKKRTQLGGRREISRRPPRFVMILARSVPPRATP